jgi:flavin-binding protein dodecin
MSRNRGCSLRVGGLSSSLKGTSCNFQEAFMSDHHVYKKVEIIGSSKKSIEDAIENALEECGKSVRNMEWFEVTETRGHIVDGKVGHYQVVMKVGFRIADS